MNTGKAHVSCCVIGPRFSGGSATAFPLPQPPPQAARTGRLGRGHGVGFALTPAEAGAYHTTAKALSRYPCYSLENSRKHARTWRANHVESQGRDEGRKSSHRR